MDANIVAPNHTYLEMSFVGETATGKGLNQTFVMEAMPNGKCRCTEGRIGIRVGINKPRSWEIPMNTWDETYANKVAKGWLTTKTVKMEQKKVTHNSMSVDGHHYKEITEPQSADIVQRLLEASAAAVEESYTTRVECVSDEMLALGRSILDKMGQSADVSVSAFNNMLTRLYAAIPRRIDNLSGKLAKRQADFGRIVEAENDTLDNLIAQIKLQSTATDLATQTITEAFGLEWRLATPEEKEFVLQTMDAKNRGCVTNVFRVVNKKTEERFNKWCEAHNISEGNGISHLFHGSPMQNWWSITTNGLWIRPGLNGGMFGPGLYFAPESDKSVGYTGFGCWRSQGDAYGYLSLNKVATGTPFYYYRSNGSSADMSLMAMNKHNTNCLWAESEKKLHNSPLRRDEVIIYDDALSTIEYLIEVKNPHSY